MSKLETDTDTRKISDVLLSLEEKVLLLIKTVAANDMNNKLILSSLNKLLATPMVAASTIGGTMPSVAADIDSIREFSKPPLLEVNQNPIMPKRQMIIQSEKSPPKETAQLISKPAPQIAQSNKPKIPVGQRLTDTNGKDLFMADVLITNMETGEVVNKSKTNAVGKWQAYLSIGKYSIHISKITDSVTLHKIESLQELEITPQMKSLQLPLAIIKR